MIYLIRHTTPDVLPGVCYGQSDVALAASYPEELAAIRAVLPKTIDHCYTSPLSRCARLAADLGPKKTVTDNSLQELNFGDWELKPWDELGPEAADWGDHFVTQRCPNGESFTDLIDRVTAWWQELPLPDDDRTVVVVTHATPLRAILIQLLGLAPTQAFDMPIPYGRIIPVEHQDGEPYLAPAIVQELLRNTGPQRG